MTDKYHKGYSPITYCETGKPKYNKKGAQTAINKRWDQDHKKLRMFSCKYCNGWHLTSEPFMSYRVCK